jgi:butyryl-CoA dehydrogenase/short/branched chain acyl-CoA dehydrogenase
MTIATTTEAARPLTELAADEKQFRDEVRKFAEQHVAPLVREMDRDAVLSPVVLRQLFDAGLMGLAVPEEYGGRGKSHFIVALAIEELSRVDPAVAVVVDVQNVLVAGAIAAWGSPEQKRRYLTALAGDTVGAFSISEQGAGSDAFALETVARQEGDGYVLNGRKYWTTNGAEAGIVVVFAQVMVNNQKRGISAFVLDRSTPGWSVGKKEDKLGIRASSTCELVLQDVRVGRSALLGPVGAGFDIATSILSCGRIGIAAQMLGLAQGAHQAAVGYAKKRRQFGQAIGSFQAVQFDLARMAIDIDAARLLVYNAARLADAGCALPLLITASAKAKYFASQVAERVASETVEVFGGNGFVKDFPAEKFYRDAKIGKIYEGTSNMQLRIVASDLLGALR